MRAVSRLSPGSIRRAAVSSMVLGALSLSVLSLVGCTDSDFSLTADDAVGTWRAGSDLPAQLELTEDGVFRATSWPLDVACNGTSPLTVTALSGSVSGDFAGTWEEGDGGSLNELTFYPEGDRCHVPSISAQFRSEGGVKYACLDLGVPNERADAESFFILYLGEPEVTPELNACFSYN